MLLMQKNLTSTRPKGCFSKWNPTQIMGGNSLPIGKVVSQAPDFWIQQQPGIFTPNPFFLFFGRIWPKPPEIWNRFETSLEGHRSKQNIGSVSSAVLYDFAQQRVFYSSKLSRVKSSICHTKSLQESHRCLMKHLLSHSANGEPFNLCGLHVW